MEYFVKRVLPIAVVGISGGTWYGFIHFMKYLDKKAGGPSMVSEKESKHRNQIR